MRFLCLALLLRCAPLHAADSDGPAQSILNLLDYVAVAYPGFVQGGKVLDADEYAEQVEFSGQVERRIRALSPKPDRDALAQQAQAPQRAILDKRDGADVVALAREIQRDLIAAYDVQVTPRKAPDLTGAQALYSAHCASCHGAQGGGDGPVASGLDPRPTNFQDAQRAAARSVFGLYNTISAGVAGTAMPAFGQLSADERWALAFRVSQFSATDAQRAAGGAAWRAGQGKGRFATLGAVVLTTPAEARAQGLEEALAYLRSEPGVVEAGNPSPIDFSMATLERSRAAWRQGRSDEAYRLAVTAYLEGFELAEAAIDSADRGLRSRTEQAMMAYRNAVQRGAPAAEVEAAFDSAMGLLRDARHLTEGHAASPQALSGWSCWRG